MNNYNPTFAPPCIYWLIELLKMYTYITVLIIVCWNFYINRIIPLSYFL